jgi:putative aldouronate transport system substrate-binding protein
MLWDEGLMDQDVITLDDTSIKGKVHNDQIGISVTSMGQMNNWNNERIAKGQEAVWVGCPYPKADDGSLSSVTGGFGIGHYTGVITKTADEETMKLCLQMLDYAYTQEGFLYWNYGTEGVSWVWGEDGIPKFTDLVNNDPDTDPMRKYNAMTFGGTGIQATNLLYLKNAPAAIEANNIWFYNFEDEEKNLAVTGGWRWPVGVTFTVDEMDMINIYGGSLNTFVSECFQAFLTGAMDIDDDATWEKYLKDAETYNLSKILKIRQDCYDRYLAR